MINDITDKVSYLMKKSLIVIGIGGCAVISLLIVYFLTRIGGEGLPIGRYNIVDNARFPEAYIQVMDTTVQFFNIDLNEYYQEKQMTTYRRVLDNDQDWYGIVSDDELRNMTDLNAVFVERAYDYTKHSAKKIGTNIVAYLMLYHDNFLGLAIHYNTKTGHLDVMRSGITIAFEKE